MIFLDEETFAAKKLIVVPDEAFPKNHNVPARVHHELPVRGYARHRNYRGCPGMCASGCAPTPGMAI